ncbi:MAG: MoaD/ThiS family protein [Steroidobacteraceae bacterium]
MSIVQVSRPGALRPFAAGQALLEVGSGTLAEILLALGQAHPQLLPRLLGPDGSLRPYVNVFLGADNVRELGGLTTQIPPGSTITILPAVAGG